MKFKQEVDFHVNINEPDYLCNSKEQPNAC